MEKSVYKNSGTLFVLIVETVESANKNGTSEGLDIILKDYTELICKETFMDSNECAANNLGWITVDEGQMKEVLNPN